jgi:hypothetical protein
MPEITCPNPLGGAKGRHQDDAQALQALLEHGKAILPIPQEQAGGHLSQLKDDDSLVDVSRSQAQSGDHPWPRHPRMYPEAREGLPGSTLG